MYARKVNVFNLKSCKNVQIDLLKDDPTTLIGKNDSGKSVILKSLGYVLGNKDIQAGSDISLTSDISNSIETVEGFNKTFDNLGLPHCNYENNAAYILVELQVEESDITDDFNTDASNLLKWSIEGSSERKIWVLKKYSAGQDKGQYFILTRDTDERLELWTKTQTDLNRLLKEHEITQEDIDNENSKGPFSNLEKIRAFYNKKELTQKWVEYGNFTSKKELNLFPTYRYIDWNISLKEIETLAKDTLEPQIDVFKDELVNQAKDLSGKVNTVVNDELSKHSESIFDSNSNLKKLKVGVSFSVEDVVSDFIIQKENNDGDINLESQGEGIKRQIMFAILRWASINSVDETNCKKYIWCFDEPEVHLYPSAQRDLYDAINELSKGIFQVILSTHSTVFINRQNIKSISRLSLKNGYTSVDTTKDINDIHETLRVFNSDILFFDKFVAVEGPTEFGLFPHVYKLIKGRSLQEDNVKLINLGGANNRSHNKKILENLLSDFRNEQEILFILDGDTEVVSNNVSLLGTYDLEDSLSDQIWINITKNVCKVDVTTDEIQEIRIKMGKDNQNKFHKLLSDLVASKNPEVYLPSKGESLASILVNEIKSDDHVPDCLKTAISKIN